MQKTLKNQGKVLDIAGIHMLYYTRCKKTHMWLSVQVPNSFKERTVA